MNAPVKPVMSAPPIAMMLPPMVSLPMRRGRADANHCWMYVKTASTSSRGEVDVQPVLDGAHRGSSSAAVHEPLDRLDELGDLARR